MNRTQVKKWVADHIGQPHRRVYNDLSGYKYQYQNGDTYEVKVIYTSSINWYTQIIINGQEVE